MNQRIEAVERWAHYVKNNPKKWKKAHTEFINAQFEKQEEFINRLLNEKNGAEKIIQIYNIKNPNTQKLLKAARSSSKLCAKLSKFQRTS